MRARRSLVAAAPGAALATGGLTGAQLDACLRDVSSEKALIAGADHHLYVDRVTVTPTFIINGRRVQGGMSLPELDAAIARAAG